MFRDATLHHLVVSELLVPFDHVDPLTSRKHFILTTAAYWVLLGVTGWVRFLHPGSLTVGSTAKMLGKEMRLPCCKHDHCCNQNDDCNHVITD